MSKREVTFILLAATVSELLFLALFVFTTSGNGGGIWIPNGFQFAYLVFHMPAVAIVEIAQRDDFAPFWVCGLITGTFQFFLIYSIAVIIWGRTPPQ